MGPIPVVENDKTLWFTRCLLGTSFSRCYGLEGSSQSTNTHTGSGFKNSSPPVQFCHSRRQSNLFFLGGRGCSFGKLSVSGAISQPRGVKHGGSFNHRISISWNEVGLQKTFGVCTCTFGGGWWKKIGRKSLVPGVFWRILKVYIYVYILNLTRHIYIYMYLYINISHYYTVFSQTSWISEAKRKGLPKRTRSSWARCVFSLDQGRQRKSPRVNILRGIWTLMNGRRVFPCKFEVIEKTHPPHLRMIELLSQLHMKSQKSRTSSMSSPFFVITLLHLGDRRRKNTGAGWLWDTSSGHDPVYASPIHCLTSSWWRIVLQRPGLAVDDGIIDFFQRSWNPKCFQDVFFLRESYGVSSFIFITWYKPL